MDKQIKSVVKKLREDCGISILPYEEEGRRIYDVYIPSDATNTLYELIENLKRTENNCFCKMFACEDECTITFSVSLSNQKGKKLWDVKKKEKT